MNQRIISFIVANEPGVLSRISGLISRRGYNIDSLTVGVTRDNSLSRITIVMQADDQITAQVVKQLNKLIDVKHVRDLPVGKRTLSEIALIKVGSNGDKVELIEKANKLWGRIVDMGDATLTVELSGNTQYIDDAIEELTPFGIKEIARTGMVALERGDETLNNY